LVGNGRKGCLVNGSCPRCKEEALLLLSALQNLSGTGFPTAGEQESPNMQSTNMNLSFQLQPNESMTVTALSLF
jgi:hypothetical protein